MVEQIDIAQPLNRAIVRHEIVPQRHTDRVQFGRNELGAKRCRPKAGEQKFRLIWVFDGLCTACELQPIMPNDYGGAS